MSEKKDKPVPQPPKENGNKTNDSGTKIILPVFKHTGDKEVKGLSEIKLEKTDVKTEQNSGDQ